MKEKMINRISPKLKKGEKIFANQIFNKNFIKNMKITFRTQLQEKKNQANDLNRYFGKNDFWMANKHKKKYSTLLVIKKVQIKITIKYYQTYIRIAKKKVDNTKC